MVDDEVQRSAEELRETAGRLRLLAQQTRSHAARGGLLDLAERFERMAAQIDRRGAPANC
jgi:predicted component of type VI protein secretion system